MTGFQSPEFSDTSSGRNADQMRRNALIALTALLCLGGVAMWRLSWSAPVDAPPAKVVVAPKNPVLDNLVDSVKGLEVSQQQSIDQLQSMQDTLLAQQTEAKKSAELLAIFSGKLDALQRSFASVQQAARAPEQAAPAPEVKRKPIVRRRSSFTPAKPGKKRSSKS